MKLELTVLAASTSANFFRYDEWFPQPADEVTATLQTTKEALKKSYNDRIGQNKARDWVNEFDRGINQMSKYGFARKDACQDYPHDQSPTFQYEEPDPYNPQDPYDLPGYQRPTYEDPKYEVPQGSIYQKRHYDGPYIAVEDVFIDPLNPVEIILKPAATRMQEQLRACNYSSWAPTFRNWSMTIRKDALLAAAAATAKNFNEGDAAIVKDFKLATQQKRIRIFKKRRLFEEAKAKWLEPFNKDYSAIIDYVNAKTPLYLKPFELFYKNITALPPVFPANEMTEIRKLFYRVVSHAETLVLAGNASQILTKLSQWKINLETQFVYSQVGDN